MSRVRWGSVAVVGTVVSVAGAAGLWFVYRPWALNWGATEEEITLAMPGDSILTDPTFNATRAVTIGAAPAEIWPWIIQMGYKRAGFYSYDLLDNAGIPSADRILREFQHLEIGDSIPLTARDYVTVTVLARDRWMLWEYRGDDATTVFTWAWRLYASDEHRTRLVTRLRYHAPSVRSRLMLDFFEIWMMRKCMLGIRRRAENAPVAHGT